MILSLFSVHDSKTNTYLPPIAFRSIGEASRAFEVACKDETSNFFKFPSDFSFIELGTFDEITGLITMHQMPKIIHNASEFKNTISYPHC